MDEREREKAATDDMRAERDLPVSDRPSPANRRSRLGIKLLGIFLVLPSLLIALWMTIALHWSYSRGERAGFIQKFSQKGWVCKTWEGELAMVNIPGTAQEKFPFTVRDDSVAAQIAKVMGSRVAISYEQHKGVPGSCFGETEYFVTKVQAVQ